MSEKLTPQGPETAPKAESKESREQLEKVAEKLRENAEKEAKSHERKKASHEAKKSAEKEAISGSEKGPSSEKKSSREPVHRHVKKQNYKATMRRVEAKLPAYQRTFSKVINNDTVDKVSNVASRTVARPSGILGGGVFAVLGLGIVTYVANNQGFPVNNGAVFIALLLIGWAAGLVLEAIMKVVRKN